LISHKRDTEHFLLSDEWYPVQKKPKEMLIFRTFKGPLTHGTHPHCRISGGPNYATDDMAGNNLLYFTSLCLSVDENNNGTISHECCVKFNPIEWWTQEV
jgi:hypothetical protein